MRKFLFCLILFSAAAFCFAQELSPEAEKEVQDFLQLRMELSAYENPQDALAVIYEFEDGLNKKRANFSEEENLVLDNFLVTEKTYYMLSDETKRKELRPLIENQRDKTESWIKSHESESPSKWIYCTCGDLIFFSMPFSINTIIKYGISVKEFYEKSIEKDPEFCYANLNYAQWYFWAPGIAGGSRKKAEEILENAFSFAVTPAEKYYAGIFYSQCLFENKKREESRAVLQVAYEQFPQSLYVKLIKECNENGYSIFEAGRKMSRQGKQDGSL